MEKIFNYLKSMDNEDAWGLLVMFCVALVVFALIGGYLHRLNAEIVGWLMFSGLVGGLIGSTAIFVKEDFFIHDIK